MPVNIPRLKKIQPSKSEPRADRFRANVANQANTILGRTQAIGSLVETATDVYIDYENDKINTISGENEQEYTIWNNQQLAKLKGIQGDPTDAYAAYDEAEKKKTEEILNKRPDLSDRAKRHVKSNFTKVQGTNRVQSLNQRGLQQQKYETDIFNSTVKLKKDTLPKLAGYIKTDDSSSFLPFDQSVNDIKTVIAERGVKTGTVKQLDPDAKKWSHQYFDEEGQLVKVEMDNIAKAQLAKELSEGISSSVKVLIDTGYPEKAKQLQERYKNLIDPLNAAKLAKTFDTADKKNSAHVFMQDIENLPDEEQVTRIEAISDSELKSEVLKIKDTNDNRRENIRDRRSKANYDALSKHVFNRMNSSQPFYGVSELESDPLYKQTWDNISVKRRQAITEMIKAPKESADGSQVRVQNLLFGADPDNQVETITPEEFNTYLAGLSKQDRNRYTGLFNGLRIETASEQRQQYKRAEKFLIDSLLVHEEIEKDKFGKFDEDDTITIIEGRNELIDYLDSAHGVFSDKQLKDVVNQFTAAKVEEKTFSPKPRKPTKVKKTREPIFTSAQEKANFKIDFRREHGYAPKSDSEEFFNFVKKNRENQ